MKRPIISLLSLSPLHAFSNNYGGVDKDASPQKERNLGDVEVASKFTSEIHRAQIIDVLENFITLMLMNG